MTTRTQDEQKRMVAREALRYVVDDAWLGVGSGSTANFFIDELARIKHRIKGAIASSAKTAERLKAHGIDVEELNNVSDIPVYVDGADEVTASGDMIKGGGGALTREKIIAAVAEKFVCIIGAEKRVDVLGRFPVPIEVIPMARDYVSHQIVRRGGQPVWRESVITDNGNWIIDVHGWQIDDPVAMERDLNQITGVVTVGLFAQRPADIVLIGAHEMI
jgi:ribose 5-phosphate isomerase A